MVLRFLHWLASNGWVYDRIQWAAGEKRVDAAIARSIPTRRVDRVLDVGGGTGALRHLWPPEINYICLDLEFPKLETFRHKTPQGIALQANATRMPIAPESVDAIICTKLAHHLSKDLLELTLRECRRVLKPNGYFVFLDALSLPDRWMSNVMWSRDRGSHPYSPEELLEALGRHFEVVSTSRFATLHEFLLVVLR